MKTKTSSPSFFVELAPFMASRSFGFDLENFGFAARNPDVFILTNMKLAACIFGMILCAMLLFPPYTQEGEWLDWASLDRPGKIIAATGKFESELNKDYFGYKPDCYLFGYNREGGKTFYEQQVRVRTPKGIYILMTSEVKINWRIFYFQLAMWSFSVSFYLFGHLRRRKRA